MLGTNSLDLSIKEWKRKGWREARRGGLDSLLDRVCAGLVPCAETISAFGHSCIGPIGSGASYSFADH
jgi:hypothetical protein